VQAAVPKVRYHRRMSGFLFCLLAPIALGGMLGTSARAADEPSATGPAVRSYREALERFGKMSPEERLQQVEKMAGGGQAFVAVTRGDLYITVTERGTLEAADATDVACRVKAKERSTPVATSIKWVIEDGTLVKKGQRLVELDDSALRDQARMQEIALSKATADKVAAEENFKMVEKQNQLDIRSAEIKLKLAHLELKKFTGKDADAREILALKVAQAQVNLETVHLQSKGKAVAAETQAKMHSAIESQEVEKKRDLESQLAACLIKAPQAGLVVYHVPEGARWGGNSAVVAPGEPVREGQKLMSVCGLERFAMTCRVHEALIARVRVGQPAGVSVDAFPKRVLRARVKTVASVPDRQDFLTADVKVYSVVVDIPEQLVGHKPGMSAEVQILLDRRPNVLRVPVESVLGSGRDTFCFVRVGKGLQIREVKTGTRNNFQTEIKAGLKEDEWVVRVPRAVLGVLARPKAKAAKDAADGQAQRSGPAQILVNSVRLKNESTRRTRIESFGLTYQDLARIQSLPDATEVVPVRSFPIDARRLAGWSPARIISTVPAYSRLAGIRLAAGRFLDDEDNLQMQNVAVLGADAAGDLFPGEDPVGKVVRLGRACTSYVVVGVLWDKDRPAGGLKADEVNRGVYIPLRTCKARFGERIIDRQSGSFRAEAVALTEILVAAPSPEQARFVGDCIAARLEETHRRKDWDVRASTSE
jgi:multidrug efflux pump subunit AcrA (membrane-fusion protein)